jgi:hypothetical protein
MDNLKNLLKRYRVDVIYGKKKHLNAAERKRKYHRNISIAVIIIDVITGSTFLYVICESGRMVFIIVSLILILISALLTGIQEFMKFDSQAEGNAKIGDNYLKIGKYINATLALFQDEKMSDKELQKRVDTILEEIDKTNQLSEKFSTCKKDYILAKAGIQNGEEEYTDEDLKMWE